MDGLLIVNKPKGITSHDVCEKLKRILKTKKIGHTGTLDPMAEGVLVVAVGKATKLIQYLENQEKAYVAEALLGVETDTYDILGHVLKEKKDFEINHNQVNKALANLKTKESQIPPIYSAIKVNGKKLYDYALQNLEVEIKARPIKIKELNLLSLEKKDNQWHVKFLVEANKGFYVRSLIHDLGLELDTYATMSSLIRVKAGIFTLDDCQTLAEIVEKEAKLLSIEEVFKDYPKVEVNDYIAKLTKSGLQFDERQFQGNSLFKVYNQGKLIAIYTPCGEKNYKPVVYLGE